VYFAGDTAYFPEFGRIGERYGPHDVVLLPIGAYEPQWFMRSVHMNPDEAVRAFGDLHSGDPRPRPGVLAAMHWGTFRLTVEPVLEPPERTRAAWQLAGRSPDDLWIFRHGETRSWKEERGKRKDTP
jgi:L-ascorbate metabolism protein UlaG (beta-lactamase superfamily)